MGGIASARVTRYETLDLKEIRKKMNLPQSQFAGMLGVSVRTLRNWEKLKQVPTNLLPRLLEMLSGNQFDDQALDEFVRRFRNKQLLAEINDACSTPPTKEEIEIMKFGLSHARAMARKEPWE